MTGEELIHNMPIKAIEKAFGISHLSAISIKNKDKQGLIDSCLTCPQLLDLETKWPCNFQETSCKACMKEFLEKEVPGTMKILKGPCLSCMERGFCSGDYPCEKLKAFEKGK